MTFYTDSPNSTNISLCTNQLSLQNTEVSQNSGIVGSGLYFEFQMKTSHSNCQQTKIAIINATFDANSVEIPSDSRFKLSGNGVAMHIVAKYHRNFKIQRIPDHYSVLIEDCTFKNSFLTNFKPKNNYTQLALPAMTTVLILNANSRVNIKDCTFEDNKFPAIGLHNSEVTFSGEVEIRNNSGIYGGGFVLCDSSYIYLPRNTTIRLTNNSAVHSGGGIFVEEKCLHSKPFCFYQLDFSEEQDCSQVADTVNIIMLNNKAGYAGDQVYGGALDNCKINDCKSREIFENLFSITPDQIESDYTAVTSGPRKICFCSQGTPSCTNNTLNYTGRFYPGENITVEVGILGQFDGLVPATLLVYSQTAKSMPVPYTIGKQCKSLKITIHGDSSGLETISLQMSSDISSQDIVAYSTPAESLYVNVHIKKCPTGFIFTNNTCQCLPMFKDDFICDIEKHIITRHPPYWVGFDNQTGKKVLIFPVLCPYDYCTARPVNIITNDTVFDQDAQCSGNRTGFLCSQCKDGFSLSAGTSDCIKCHIKYEIVFFVLGHGIFGILLVAFLVLFNITNTDGTFSGLLFYANIVNLNNYIFSPSNYRNVLSYIISFIGVKSGYNACLIDGMDAYGKAWFSFCFPLYLIVITVTIIILCRKSERISRLFGGNIIKVLATLFQLTYTKLLHNVVTILSFTVIYHTSEQYQLHWLYDPSLRYFSGKHIPLALVAIVFGLLILAYTLVLLFVQPLQRYSHLPCFSWMAKLKPLIDAYTAPHVIKDNCRYWEGLLLFLRLVLCMVFAVNVKGRTETNLSAISIVCLLLLTVVWSTSGIYKQHSLNILNLLSITNLGILSIAVNAVKDKTRYIYQYKHLDNPSYQYITYTSFAVEAMVLVGVLSFHIYKRLFTWHERYKQRGYQELSMDTADDQPGLPPLRRVPDDHN